MSRRKIFWSYLFSLTLIFGSMDCFGGLHSILKCFSKNNSSSRLELEPSIDCQGSQESEDPGKLLKEILAIDENLGKDCQLSITICPPIPIDRYINMVEEGKLLYELSDNAVTYAIAEEYGPQQCYRFKSCLDHYTSAALFPKIFQAELIKNYQLGWKDGRKMPRQKPGVSNIENNVAQFLDIAEREFLSCEKPSVAIKNTTPRHKANMKEKKVKKEDVFKKGVNIAKKLLQDSGSLIIGERHGQASAKKLIIEMLPEMKQKGSVLALEHLLYIPYQALLDQYVNAAADAPMPKILEAYLKKLDTDNLLASKNGNFYDLVKAAKEHGVRMVAIDTVSSYTAGYLYSDGVYDDEKRFMGLSYAAKAILEKETAPTLNPSVVFLVGSAHVSTRKGVPGMSEIMNGTPTMVIDEKDEGMNKQEEREEKKEKKKEKTIGIHLNVVAEDESKDPSADVLVNCPRPK
ncbi:MAG: ChaN family lipoprotein [Oligoflexia bacterium]|nr:ChaN family lipoprotein [Oligoflexia bacterium]